MGQLDVKQLIRYKDKALYAHHLIKDLEALDMMLDQGIIEKHPIRIGAEQELCLVDSNFSPSENSLEILKEIKDPHFTTEIGRYNLEINSDPLELGSKCFSQLHNQLKGLLKLAELKSKHKDTKVVLTGILPTFRLKHISENYMTKVARYSVLNESLKTIRGQEFNIHIKGVDELNLLNRSVMFEACNTSFQTHLQINPDVFVDKYNWAQAIAAPVLAICTNSPMLFGKELWAETRIALFTQSIDTRENTLIFNNQQSRVSFGVDWERGTATDIFKDHISIFRSLVTSPSLEDSVEKLNNNEIPKLKALQLHNGTVYKWNRVCYGVGGGKPHLRIECRYIPSGPTLIDEIANMVFWVGLMLGQSKEYNNIHDKMDFKDVKNNFFKAARYGLETQFVWNNTIITAKTLIQEHLLPIAYKGLREANINEEDITRYLSVIDRRLENHNGSQWIVKNFRHLQKTHTNFEALQNITAYMHKNQLNEEGVDQWKLIESDKILDINASRIVKHNMHTKILLVDQNESLELVMHIMKWKKIHHMPVINRRKKLTGILSWTDVIKLGNTDLKLRVKDVMSKNVITVSQEAPLQKAIELMGSNNINCLPVVKNKKVIGIITTNDI